MIYAITLTILSILGYIYGIKSKNKFLTIFSIMLFFTCG